MLPLVVCSRVVDYEALKVRLRLQGAIVIQPLTPVEVEAYLTQVGASLAGVRQALQENSTLGELFNTPFMLSIVAMAYAGRPVAEQHTSETPEVRRRHLFAAYVERMLQRRSISTRYAHQQTENWLAWLAFRPGHWRALRYSHWGGKRASFRAALWGDKLGGPQSYGGHKYWRYHRCRNSPLVVAKELIFATLNFYDWDSLRASFRAPVWVARRVSCWAVIRCAYRANARVICRHDRNENYSQSRYISISPECFSRWGTQRGDHWASRRVNRWGGHRARYWDCRWGSSRTALWWIGVFAALRTSARDRPKRLRTMALCGILGLCGRAPFPAQSRWWLHVHPSTAARVLRRTSYGAGRYYGR